MKNKMVLSTLLFASTIFADESLMTSLALNVDDSGNMNPELNIPIYYGSSNQYYSAIGYKAINSNKIEKLDGFENSKNSFVSNSKSLRLNYITYKNKLFTYDISIGIESTLSQIKNDEFGYIHDSKNIFNKGTEYYISYDNLIELDLKKHSIYFDIDIPFGNSINSRLSISISPFSTIGVDQTTIFKPLADEKGVSNSSTQQDIAYSIKYNTQLKTDMFFDMGAVFSYDNQPLKYDVAVLNNEVDSYSFITQTVDTTEVRKLMMAKIIFHNTVLGGLKPSVGVGIERLTIKDNINNSAVSTNMTQFSFGLENNF